MRLLLSCTLLMTLLCAPSLTAHAQTDEQLPPATLLALDSEPLGTANTVAVAYADLDQDGDRDAFILEWNYNEIWFNQGNAHYLQGGQRFGDGDQSAVALGDLDNDGDSDAFIAKQGSASGQPANEVWLNDGNGRFADSGQRLSANDLSAYVAVQLGDFEQDGDLDAFVVANGPSCGVSRLWLNDGNGQFAEAAQNWPGCDHRVALGDLNHDQHLDIIFNRQSGMAGLTVWLSQGKLAWTQAQVVTAGYNAADLALGDLDGDDDLDLWTTGYMSENFVPDRLRFNKLWLNDGTGNLHDSGQWLPHFPRSSFSEPVDAAVTLRDIDQDGDVDGITATRFSIGISRVMWETTLIVHFNDGGGHFTQSLLRSQSPTAPTSLDSQTVALTQLTQQFYLPLILQN